MYFSFAALQELLTPRNLTALFLVYLLLIRTLRYRRTDSTASTYSTRAGLSRMTIRQAQLIVNTLGEFEFPFTNEKGLQFALFRTYGIPTISSLLASTTLFSNPATSSKRYTDTAVLVAEFMGREYGTPEWVAATSRMNCLHGLHQREGKISNEDMLYTLALFVREPWAWIDRWEWRRLNNVEKNAIGVFWAAMGEAMGIELRGLPTYDAGRGFVDGLQFLEELCDWAEQYEREHMVPNEKNFLVAEQTVALLLYLVPSSLKTVGKKAVYTLMDERLRRSMLYPDPPARLTSMVHGLLRFRALMIRHLFPPRYYPWRFELCTSKPSEHGTYYMHDYLALPFYVKPTIFSRWGPGSWTRRVQGLPLPGDEGQKYCPMGFTTSNVGPDHSKKDQKAMEEKVAGIAAGSFYPSCFAAV